MLSPCYYTIRSHTAAGQDFHQDSAGYFDVTPDEITGKRRTEKIAYARSVVAYLLTQRLEDVPLTEIGEILGGRTYASVIFSRNKIGEQLKKDAKLKSAIDDILKQLDK